MEKAATPNTILAVLKERLGMTTLKLVIIFKTCLVAQAEAANHKNLEQVHHPDRAAHHRHRKIKIIKKEVKVKKIILVHRQDQAVRQQPLKTKITKTINKVAKAKKIILVHHPDQAALHHRHKVKKTKTVEVSLNHKLQKMVKNQIATDHLNHKPKLSQSHRPKVNQALKNALKKDSFRTVWIVVNFTDVLTMAKAVLLSTNLLVALELFGIKKFWAAIGHPTQMVTDAK